MTRLAYIFLLSLISCSTTKNYSETKYNDQIVSKTVKVNGIYTRTFIRHGLTYTDKIAGKKLIERTVYEGSRLMYHYPITRATLRKSEIKLLSGNNYLVRGITDTIQYFNKDLPPMNHVVYVSGAAISRISETTFLIKTTDQESQNARFIISVHHNFEEVKNSKGFISDSLILPIK